jgi:quercetin dioxygenase-like cupin family protein
MNENPTNKDSVTPIEALKGVFRKTLVYNDKVMLCFFRLNKDAEIPLHNHEAHQIGYVIKGKIKFLTENDEFIAIGGDSYVFDSYKKHGAKLIEDTEIIEAFCPTRDDYR